MTLAVIFSKPLFCFFRLKDVEPVTYCEIEPKKEKRSEGGKTVLMEVGAKEEIYTEEHDKLLGTCNTLWTLFVDGYGKDGKRIYDQVRGQTCHQCRYVSTRITIF
jgi:cell division cycle-associated protein 7